MPSTHIERIRAQFTRQRDAYLAQPDVGDERSLEALAALAGARPGLRALDVACGPGLLALALARAGADVVGVDATPAFVEHARAQALQRRCASARFETGDAEALAFAAGRFDVVVCRSAFHHFPRPERVLAEMRRVVVPGGRILVADMLGSSDPGQADAQQQVEKLCDPTHERALTAEELEALGRAAGLVLERAIRGELHHDVEEWIRHGGPPAAAADEIRRRMSAWAQDDPSGLRVRREQGALRFTHPVGVFVFARP